MITLDARDHYELILEKNGDDQIIIHNSDHLSLRIKADKHIHAQLWIAYDGEQLDLHTQLYVGESSDIALLFWNRVSGKLNFSLNMSGERDAHAKIGIGDLSEGISSYQLQGTLSEGGLDTEWTTVCIANHKHWQMELCHQHAHTSGIMRNFAVVTENGDYKMEASGRIVKGAHASQSHQASRVLTMTSKQRSEVLPILYIDEDDVKASHATTLGQPDENQLYYLQSRGLSRSAALGLMTLGYLMPITEVISQEEWQTQLQKEIEEKVIIHD